MPRKFIRCMVNKCPSFKLKGKESDVGMFFFPRRDSLAKKWLSFCKNPKITGKKSDTLRTYSICGKHFSEDQFVPNQEDKTIKRLKPNVVPTLFPPLVDETLEEDMPNPSPLKNVDASTNVTSRSPIKISVRKHYIKYHIKKPSNVIKPSLNVIKPSLNVIKPSLNIIKPSPNIIKPSPNIIKSSPNIAKPSSNIVHKPLTPCSKESLFVAKAIASCEKAEENESDDVIPICERIIPKKTTSTQYIRVKKLSTLINQPTTPTIINKPSYTPSNVYNPLNAENAQLKKDHGVVIQEVRSIADEDFQNEDDPDIEIVNAKGVKVCEFGTQTDFDHRPVQNNLNMFYCSLYNDNEVSTYCNLSPPTPAAPSLHPLIPRLNFEKLMHNDHIKHMKTQPKQNITSQGSQTPKSLIRSIIFEEARNIVKNPTNKNSVEIHRSALSSLVQEEIKKIPASFVSNDYPMTGIGDINPRVIKPKHLVGKMVEKIDFEKDCREFYDSNNIQVEGEGDEKRFKCLGCCVNLTNPNELIQHIKNNHRPRNIALRCNQCPVAFPLAFQLQDHKEQIHGESRQIKCGFCNKSFSETRIYIRHVMLRHAKKTTKFTVRCQTCSVVCKNMKVYRKHQIIHMRETQNKSVNPRNVADGFDSDDHRHLCIKCDRVFNSEYALTLHKAHKHKPNHGNICHICNKKFQYPSQLNYHMDWHKGIRSKKGTYKGSSKRYECHVCLKNTFKTKFILHSHLLCIHKIKTDDMNYLHSCTICGKEFVFPSKLKEHIKTHHEKTVRIKHSCTICGKQLSTGQSLKNHMAAVHYPEQCKFVCTVCGKRFSIKHHLKEHMITHNDEKPHGCAECEAKFKFKGNLRHHIKSVHGVPVERVSEDGTVSIEFHKIKRGPRAMKPVVVDTIETEMAVSHIEHGTEMEVEGKDFYITPLSL